MTVRSAFIVLPLLVPTVFTAVIFIVGVIYDWRAMTTPESLDELRDVYIGLVAMLYVIAGFVVVASNVEERRARRRRPEVTTESVRSESTRMLEYWWLPLALSGAFTLMLIILGVLWGGWETLTDVAGIAELFAFVAAVVHIPALVAFVAQVIHDRRESAKRKQAPARRLLTDAELVLLHEAGSQSILKAARNARFFAAAEFTLLLPLLAMFGTLFGILYAAEVVEGFGLGPTWQRGAKIAASVIGIGGALALWALRLHALRTGVDVLLVTVRSVGANDIQGVKDAVGSATGVHDTAMDVTVYGVWKLTGRPLRVTDTERFPDGQDRTLSRGKEVAAHLSAGEQAVLLCSGGRVLGRLSSYVRTRPARS